MLNKVLLIGNLGRDPEQRTTPGGLSVTDFSLATTQRWKDRDGKPQEETEWHRVVAFGKTAELAARLLTQGRQVYVEGRLRTRSWEDQETGKKMSRTEIVLDSFKLLGPRPSGAAEEAVDHGDEAGDDIPY
jgi:single-strand DNA-binding protein